MILRAGIAIAIVLALVLNISLYGAKRYRDGLETGTQRERAAWEEVQRKVRAQMEADRHAAQAEIDRVEREYQAQRDRDRDALTALEATIADMERDDASNAAGPMLFDRRLFRDLAPIGRRP